MSSFWNKVEATIYRAAANTLTSEEATILALLPQGEASVDAVVAALESKLPPYVRLLAAPEIDVIVAQLKAEAPDTAKGILDRFAASLVAQANKIDPPAVAPAAAVNEDPHRAAAVEVIRKA